MNGTTGLTCRCRNFEDTRKAGVVPTLSYFFFQIKASIVF